MAPEHRWMTTDEVATELGVSRSTVRRWLREQKIEGQRIGKRWLVPQPKNVDLTLAQTAQLVRAHPDTVRRWIVEGKLPAKRSGKQWLVPQADVIRIIEGPAGTSYSISNN